MVRRGIIFAVLLALTERRRRFEQMSLARFAGWGALGGLLLAAVFARLASLGWGDLVAVTPTFALASAVCASGSLALARRTEQRELGGGAGYGIHAKLPHAVEGRVHDTPTRTDP
jgi:hypothetical protein